MKKKAKLHLAPEAQARALFVALGRVVEDDVHDDLDAPRVAGLDHFLELADHGAAGRAPAPGFLASKSGRRETGHRREKPDGRVPPVVEPDRAGLSAAAVVTRQNGVILELVELVHGQELDGVDAERGDVVELLGQRGVGAAEGTRGGRGRGGRSRRLSSCFFAPEPGARVRREASHVHLVDHEVLHRRPQRAVPLPVEGGLLLLSVADAASGRGQAAGRLRPGAGEAQGRSPVVQPFGAQLPELGAPDDRGGVRVEQDDGVVEAVPRSRRRGRRRTVASSSSSSPFVPLSSFLLVRPRHPVAVHQLGVLDLEHRVPDVARAVEQRVELELRGGAPGVEVCAREQAESDRGRGRGEDGKVDDEVFCIRTSGRGRRGSLSSLDHGSPHRERAA